ncbi:dihydrolipoyllysine-residue acetyltransferase component 4 of pyruvate dehydrogenase complex, chloroplastic [Tanacetum coccineum]
MPALSSTMTEGKIVSWNISEGDVLSKGQSVVVESDKGLVLDLIMLLMLLADVDVSCYGLNLSLSNLLTYLGIQHSPSKKEGGSGR